MRAGALGGKLLGAGGGGFVLFYVKRDSRRALLEALSELLVVPVGFERSGTQVIFNDPDRYAREPFKQRRFVRYNVDDLPTSEA
jgi:D-glycero-alpha-D-manno-heptose-7-phosphate kinase